MSKELPSGNFKDSEVFLVPAVKFNLARPNEQRGLTLEMESGAVPEKYLNRYHTDHDIKCAFFPAHTPHRRGFTVEMSDGRIGLCGIDCAIKYFGTEIAKGFENVLKNTERDYLRDAIFAHTMDRLPKIYREIRECLIPIEIELEKILNLIVGVAKWPKISEATASGEFVVYDAKREWHEQPDGSRKPIETKREICRILGAPVLHMRKSQFRDAEVLAKEVLDGRDFRDVQLSVDRRLTARTKLIRRLEEAIAFFRAASHFFTEQNFININQAIKFWKMDTKEVEWINCDAGNQIVIIDWDDRRLTFKVPIFDGTANEDVIIRPLNMGN